MSAFGPTEQAQASALAEAGVIVSRFDVPQPIVAQLLIGDEIFLSQVGVGGVHRALVVHGAELSRLRKALGGLRELPRMSLS